MSQKVRPIGVTIIAILEGLTGLVVLLAALGSFALGGLAGTAAGGYGGIFAAFGALLGGVLLIFALICFLIAWGFWTGQSWARILGIVFAALDVLGGLLSLPSGLLTLIIGGVIIYYLFRPEVIRYFKGEPEATPVTTPTST